MGALVECDAGRAGNRDDDRHRRRRAGRGIVRWAQAGKFGVQFVDHFDLGRLAPKKEKGPATTMLRPWYVEQRERQAS